MFALSPSLVAEQAAREARTQAASGRTVTVDQNAGTVVIQTTGVAKSDEFYMPNGAVYVASGSPR